ncbi:MAG: hypothetical protein K2H09_05795 [Treponemataceae bacterium]|nr:hypothetical protein [Treponemataceae bacterium]
MTVAELKALFPNTHFIKTKTHIDRPVIALMQQEFIPDADTPEFPGLDIGTSRLYPLSITAYPAVLASMTAMEAGAWAVGKCIREHWEITKDNIESCLANLEMDF